MNRITHLLTKTSQPKMLIILVIVTIINFAIIGLLTAQISAVSGGETLLDFSFGHTVESVTMTLNNYGSEGLALYQWVQRIDLIHPLIYSLLFATLFYLLYRQTQFSFLPLLPVAGGALDYLENVFLFIMVSSFPSINPTVVQIASLVNYAKNGVTFLTIATFVIGILFFVIRRIRQ